MKKLILLSLTTTVLTISNARAQQYAVSNSGWSPSLVPARVAPALKFAGAPADGIVTLQDAENSYVFARGVAGAQSAKLQAATAATAPEFGLKWQAQNGKFEFNQGKSRATFGFDGNWKAPTQAAGVANFAGDKAQLKAFAVSPVLEGQAHNATLSLSDVSEVFVAKFAPDWAISPSPTGDYSKEIAINFPAEWVYFQQPNGGLWLRGADATSRITVNRDKTDKSKASAILSGRFYLAPAADVEAAQKLFDASVPPEILVRGADGTWTNSFDRDGDGTLDRLTVEGSAPDALPNFLDDRWTIDLKNDGAPELVLQFAAGGADKPATCEIFADSNSGKADGKMDDVERKFPFARISDWNRDGRFVRGSVLTGGYIPDDLYECHFYHGWRTVGDMAKLPVDKLENPAFRYILKPYDLDGDGDTDILQTDNWNLTKIHLDYDDVNPQHGLIYDAALGYPLLVFPAWDQQEEGNFMFFGWWGKHQLRDGAFLTTGDWPQGTFNLDGDAAPEARFYGGIYPDEARPGLPIWQGGDQKAEPFHQSIVRWCLDLDNDNGGVKNSPNAPGVTGRDFDVCFWPVKWYKPREMADGGYRNAPLLPSRVVEPHWYSDAAGNKIGIHGQFLPDKWDGKKLSALGDKSGWMNSWKAATQATWPRLTAAFGDNMSGAEVLQMPYPLISGHFDCGAENLGSFNLYWNPLDGRVHMKGAEWGFIGYGKREMSNEQAKLWEGTWNGESRVGDVEHNRGALRNFVATFDGDGDGYLDTFLQDANNDGFYERRLWFDRKTQEVTLLENGQRLKYRAPLAFEEQEFSPENYAKLSESYRRDNVKQSLLVSLEGAEPRNLLAGGDFETPDAAFVLDDKRAHGGKRSWRKETNVASEGQTYLLVDPSTEYELSAWVLGADTNKDGAIDDKDTKLSLRPLLIFGDEGNGFLPDQPKTPNLVDAKQLGEWTRISYRFKTTPQTKRLWLRWVNNVAPLWIDDVSLQTVNPLSLGAPTQSETAAQTGMVALDVRHGKENWSDLLPTGSSRLWTAISKYPLPVVPLDAEWSAASLQNTKLLVLSDYSGAAPGAAEIAELQVALKNGLQILMAAPAVADVAQSARFDALCAALGIRQGENVVRFPEGDKTQISDPQITDPIGYAKTGRAELFRDTSKAKWFEGLNKIYFAGRPFVADAATASVLEYRGQPIVVEKKVGAGRILAFAGAEFLSNRYTAYTAPIGVADANHLTPPAHIKWADFVTDQGWSDLWLRPANNLYLERLIGDCLKGK